MGTHLVNISNSRYKVLSQAQLNVGNKGPFGEGQGAVGCVIPRGGQGSDAGRLPKGSGSGTLKREVERGGHCPWA